MSDDYNFIMSARYTVMQAIGARNNESCSPI